MPETATVSIKVVAELDIPIFNLCSLIYEIELFKNWVPFCDKSSTVIILFLITVLYLLKVIYHLNYNNFINQ